MAERSRRLSRTKRCKDLEIVFEPHFLTKEEDDERIDQLAEKILACVRRIEREERQKKGRHDADLFLNEKD